jgi:ectoine hydroxylase-related dioxygenase (phytanoyl-CoA dioxygenase family)
MTKTREMSSALDWHQDAGYSRDPEHLCFSWWIALTDATRENGGLRILPGTHKPGLAKHIPSRRFPPDKEIETVDEAGALDVDLAAGDAIALDPFVFHASWPNVSGALRIGLLAGFMLPKPEYLDFEKKAGFAYARGGEPRWERLFPDAARNCV